MNRKANRRRSAVKIMGQLILMVKPLLHIMLCAIVLGVAGFLCAIFLSVLAAKVLLLGVPGTDGYATVEAAAAAKLFVLMVVIAVARGILHYMEQYCNHFIAFKLLAIIRHKVFAALRKLCPAKLEGRDKGNLISVITTDIELLEVFYAHTISPIAIAAVTSVIMVVFIGRFHLYAGLWALAAYAAVGAVIPIINGKRGGDTGMEFREGFGALNSFVLDSLRGLDETLQYEHGPAREKEMNTRSRALSGLQRALSRMEEEQRSVTTLTVLFFSFGMLFLMLWCFYSGECTFDDVVLATVSMMGSFGPVLALSSLSNNLNQTLASGERVLSILEEKPEVAEIPEGSSLWNGAGDFSGASVRNVTFAYDQEIILKNYSAELLKGKIIGISGASGSGKSTLLKLLMRFWEADQGEIAVSGENVNEIPTNRLRDAESYVTQETHLFHDSIANNIAIGKPGASREEIMEAAKKASVHDLIMTLPKGYDTEVGELGDTLSGGERQRIGIARAFLHDAPFMLLDEPTSNLDSLNEGIILKSLKEAQEDKTIVLVSHRKSTVAIADVVYSMESERIS